VRDPYEELTVSGNKPLEERIGLGPAVLDVVEGRADVLLADAEDRLWWNHGVAAEVLRLVHGAAGQVWTAAEGRIGEDDPTDELSRTVRTAANRFSRLMNAMKSRRAVESALAEGVWPAPRAPLGYRVGKDRCLAPDERAPVVAEAFALRATGASVRECRAFLAGHGIDRTMAAVERMFTNRAYVGEIHFGDHTPNPDAHPAIVDRTVFDRVQRARSPRGRHAKTDRLLARADALRCGTCGGLMSLSQTGAGRAFYRCAADDCSRRVTIGVFAEDLVRAHTRALLADARARAYTEDDARTAAADLERVEEELGALVRTYAAAGVLDEPSAVDALAGAREERDRARALVERLQARGGEIQLPAVDVFDAADVDTQRAVIRRLGVVATVAPGRGPDRVTIEPTVK
jgi:Recombinase/Resolvase, N terminal domain